MFRRVFVKWGVCWGVLASLWLASCGGDGALGAGIGGCATIQGGVHTCMEQPGFGSSQGHVTCMNQGGTSYKSCPRQGLAGICDYGDGIRIFTYGTGVVLSVSKQGCAGTYTAVNDTRPQDFPAANTPSGTETNATPDAVLTDARCSISFSGAYTNTDNCYGVISKDDDDDQYALLFSDSQKVIFSFGLEGLPSEAPGTWSSDKPVSGVTPVGTLLDTAKTRTWSYGGGLDLGGSYKVTLTSVGTPAYKGQPNPIRGTLDLVMPGSSTFGTGAVTVHAECK